MPLRSTTSINDYRSFPSPDVSSYLSIKRKKRTTTFPQFHQFFTRVLCQPTIRNTLSLPPSLLPSLFPNVRYFRGRGKQSVFPYRSSAGNVRSPILTRSRSRIRRGGEPRIEDVQGFFDRDGWEKKKRNFIPRSTTKPSNLLALPPRPFHDVILSSSRPKETVRLCQFFPGLIMPRSRRIAIKLFRLNEFLQEIRLGKYLGIRSLSLSTTMVNWKNYSYAICTDSEIGL